MILADFTQLAIATTFAFSDDMKKGRDVGKMEDIIRHVLLTSLLSYKRQYTKTYGQIVLAGEGETNWRRDTFPHYKANRKKGREESDTDWASIFSIIEQLRGELIEIFPWKFVRHKNAEGDDVIATLTEYLQENETTSGGIFDEPQPILIVSSDADFKQLHRFKNVKQFNPIMKKWVAKPEPDFLVEKIIRGDGGDGVPSVLCPDDFFINEDTGRAKPVTKKVIERFKAGIGLDEEEMRRYERNKRMVDLTMIPENIQQEIISNYKSASDDCDLQKIMNHLIQKRCRNLLNDIQSFKTK
jgi:hypothetical protein